MGSAIAGIISPKLARKLCTNCRKLRTTTKYEKDIFKGALGIDVNQIYDEVGCPECMGGYKGRIPIHEVLLLTQEIRDAISAGTSKAELRELVFSDDTNINTMLQDGLCKVLTGETTMDEILRLIQLDDEDMNSFDALVMNIMTTSNKETDNEDNSTEKNELETFSF